MEPELIVQTRGGFLLDSNYGKRDSWNSTDGTARVMEHRNPDMTPSGMPPNWTPGGRRTKPSGRQSPMADPTPEQRVAQGYLHL